MGRHERISYEDILWMNTLKTDYKGTALAALAVDAGGRLRSRGRSAESGGY